MDCTICVAKTKALISFAATAKLICVFVFAYAKSRFSHDEAHVIMITYDFPMIAGIAVMYWSTIQASDRDVIRLVLLSSIVFFALQTLGNKTCLCLYSSHAVSFKNVA